MCKVYNNSRLSSFPVKLNLIWIVFMYKPLSFIFLGTSVALGTLYFSQGGTDTQLRTLVQQDPATIKENTSLKQQIINKDKEIEELEDMIALLEKGKLSKESLPVVMEPVVASGKELVEMSPQEKKMRKMMKAKFAARTEKEYALLWKKLNLSDEAKEVMIGLIGESRMGRFQYAMAMSQAEPDEEKEEARLIRERQTAEGDTKMAELLGGQYDVYVDYQDKKQEYDTVVKMNSRLEDAALSEVQSEQLVGMMDETSKAYEFSSVEANESGTAVYTMNEEDRQVYYLELAEKNEIILENSAQFLDEEQQGILKKQQESELRRIKMRVESKGRGRLGPR